MNAQNQENQSKDLYQRAIDFYNKGKLDNAIRCCKKVIAANQNHYEAYNLLGVISQNNGKNGEAFSYIKKAIEINPAYSDGYNNLGAIHNENHSYDAAIECFQVAIRINQQYAEAFYNLGVAFHAKNMLSNAIACYKMTTDLKPEYPAAYHNMGNILSKTGNLEEAIQYYYLAIKYREKKTDITEVYVSLSNSLLYSRGVLIWRDCLIDFLKSVDFSAVQRGDLLTSLAVTSWIVGEESKCLEYLDRAKVLSLTKVDYPDLKSTLAYNNFLRSLILWHRENQDANVQPNKVLHFIGDSHSLTCANKNIEIGKDIYECKTHFVRGCKIWSLVNYDINGVKIAFDRELGYLSEGEMVVFNIGEIDCRYDEGLFFRYRKYSTNLIQEIDFLLAKYFNKIAGFVENMKIIPLIWGIPAPNESFFKGHIHKLYEDEFISFISYFNEQMSILSKQYNFHFVDNYSLTCNKFNKSNSDTHIDNVHLKPSTFIKAIKQVWQ
jgi:tetratricopeptide (TPR) repeat protein